MTKKVRLHTDSLPLEQPQNSARFVLNGMMDSSTGDVFNYTNAYGNTLVSALSESYKIIGSINLDNNDVILFSTDNTTSEIGLFNQGNYTMLINTACLGFQQSNPVKGVYRILNGCDRVIYFCDNLNPDKSINIDDLDQYQDSSGDWDCNLMRLNPDFILPQITVDSVNDSGGNLDSGAYSFVVELLDSELNSITVGLPTAYIPIYNDNQSDQYDTIHGSFTDTINSIEGGTQNTSKSVSLNLNNLDTRFDFARVIVIAKQTGTGFTEQAFELQEYIPISDNSLDFTVTTLEGATTVDIEEIQVKTIKYTTSSDMKIVDGRLVRANLQENTRDYSGYQRIVNNIDVTWQHDTENPFDTSELHNTKNPLSYQNGNTFLGDEVYALAIEFIHDDGEVSPAFHIPGRSPNAADLEQFTVGTDISQLDVQHLGLTIGDTITRWEYENTSTGISSGTLGYFQTDTNYPEDVDCEGYPIYGTLAGTPIRHHRIPCRSSRPTYFDSSGNPVVSKIGLVFSDITYPDSDIVGHRFLVAKKNESDKTVIDNGFVVLAANEAFGESFPDVSNNYVFYKYRETQTETEDVIGLVSPKILLGESLNVDYLKFVGYREGVLQEGFVDANVFSGVDFLDYSKRSYVDNLNTLDYTYRDLTRSKLISPNSIFNGDFDRPIVNYSKSNNLLATELTSPITIPTTTEDSFLIEVSLKKTATPHRNLYQLQYKPVTEVLTLDDDQVTYNGKSFVNHLPLFNVTIFERGGDQNYIAGEYMQQFFVDSEINFELRVEGTDTNTIYSENQELSTYLLNQTTDFDGTDYILKAAPTKQYYRLNLDYAPDDGGALRIPIPFNFDYCSDCINKFPNRIAWSLKSFSEQRSDTFRLNLANDYAIVGENRGEITNIHYDKNRMLVLTRNSCLALTPNPRQINTDVDTAYVGTGDFLGIPAVEFASTDYGFGGCQGRLATCNTEFGFFWVDQQVGRIFGFDGRINELSSEQYGNYIFFRENLPLIGDTNVVDTDSTISGAGIQLAYDPDQKTLVIHKSDFKTIGNIRSTDFTNLDHFENKSFTMTYGLVEQAWLSFHSWQPDFIFSDRSKFYTCLDNKIWKHNKFNTEYYGYKFPFIVEYVQANPQTTTLEFLAYYAQTISSNGLDKEYPTFNKFWCYSGDQSTGEQILIPKTDYPKLWDNTTKTVVHAEEDYRVSAIRDLSTGNTVVSSDWSDIQGEFINGQGYIDKKPVNVDFNTGQYNLIPLRNKYHIIRLYYNDTDRIIFNLVASNTKPSML